jgi:inner membrane protein
MTEAQSDSGALAARAQIFSRVSNFFRSPAVKLVFILAIGMVLTVPLGIVWLLVSERDHNSRTVIRNIGQQWGAPQRLSGPFVVLPYRVEVVGVKIVEVVAGTEEKPVILRKEEPEISEAVRFAVFTPEALRVEGGVVTNVRERSIYKATVYTADLKVSGGFAPITGIETSEKVTGIDWHKMQMVFGISGLSGIETSDLMLNSGERILLEPGAGLMAGLDTGAVHAPVLFNDASDASAGFSFRLALSLRGSESLSVTPAGRTTEVALNSPWPHPEFTGRFLPAERDIGDEGFSAQWSVPHLARPLPTQWPMSTSRLGELMPYAFGVRFVTPVDFYSLVDRALKYGLMFIGTVFIIVFGLEIATGVRVHGVQYLLVGLMMIMFFVLLLAFCEHIGFARAYLIAALATGGVLTVYVALVFKRLLRALATAVCFAVLYAILYLILQLEDYALLAGACLGFVILTGVLFGTRKIDWSAIRPADGAAVPAAGETPVQA